MESGARRADPAEAVTGTATEHAAVGEGCVVAPAATAATAARLVAREATEAEEKLVEVLAAATVQAMVMEETEVTGCTMVGTEEETAGAADWKAEND